MIMKLIQKIDWFKTSTIVILVIFILLFREYSKNERYNVGINESWIIDTRTGIMYHLEQYNSGDGWILKPDLTEDYE